MHKANVVIVQHGERIPVAVACSANECLRRRRLASHDLQSLIDANGYRDERSRAGRAILKMRDSAECYRMDISRLL